MKWKFISQNKHLIDPIPQCEFEIWFIYDGWDGVPISGIGIYENELYEFNLSPSEDYDLLKLTTLGKIRAIFRKKINQWCCGPYNSPDNSNYKVNDYNNHNYKTKKPKWFYFLLYVLYFKSGRLWGL